MSDSLSDQADEFYAAYLAERDSGKAVQLEPLLAKLAPELGEEVRRLHALCRQAEGLLAPEPDAGPPDVERYRIEGEIGRGGMARVFAAWDRELERPLAMKVVDHPAPTARDRFVAEAKLTGALDHPGIVAVHELGLEGERAWFTMAQVRGSTLTVLIDQARSRSKGWNLPRVLGVVLRVCEAVAFAHSRGVVHRDLKPANVMVGAFGETYVMDWGLARQLDEATREPESAEALPSANSNEDSDPQWTIQGDVVGTPAYMSPEQARGERDTVGPKTDVYALGAMLYHALAGTPPHTDGDRDSSPRAVLQRAAQSAVTPLEQLEPKAPAELVAIVERAMQRSPEDRYAGVLELAEDLRAHLEGRVVRAYEAGGFAELKKWIGRNRWLSAALLGILLVALGGTATTFYARGAERSRALRFLDLQLVREAREDAAQDLWPEIPSRVPAMQAWIERAEALVARLPQHRAELDRLNGLARTRGERVRRGDGTASGGFTFGDADERWRHERLSELVRELDRFAAPEGELVRVRSSLAFAQEVHSLTVLAPAEEWRAAAKRVARDPRFGGLELGPQLGLLPLGPDPVSGLEEFALLRSGTTPTRDDFGKLVLEDHSAAVLTLLPGGDTWIGRDGSVGGLVTATPRHRASLAPFLLGKHELTQSQWLALGGPDCAFHREPGPRDRLPMESVTWFEAEERLRHNGLTLPTEVQWEFAAANGRVERFAFGDSPALEELFHRAQLAREGPASVGSFPPGEFGLHDLLGNVSEWCLDPMASYERSLSGPAQFRAPASTTEPRRAYRGAAYWLGQSNEDVEQVLLFADPRSRWMPDGGDRREYLGLRLARSLEVPLRE